MATLHSARADFLGSCWLQKTLQKGGKTYIQIGSLWLKLFKVCETESVLFGAYRLKQPKLEEIPTRISKVCRLHDIGSVLFAAFSLE